MYICIYVYMYICIYVYMYKCIFVYMYCDSSNCFPFVSCTGVITESHRRSYADHLVQANRERCGVVLVLGAIR